jgi:hypothetical protein
LILSRAAGSRHCPQRVCSQCMFSSSSVGFCQCAGSIFLIPKRSYFHGKPSCQIADYLCKLPVLGGSNSPAVLSKFGSCSSCLLIPGMVTSRCSLLHSRSRSFLESEYLGPDPGKTMRFVVTNPLEKLNLKLQWGSTHQSLRLCKHGTSSAECSRL